MNVQTDLKNVNNGLQFIHKEQEKTNSILIAFMEKVNAELNEIKQNLNFLKQNNNNNTNDNDNNK